jgi:hypothetical protein
MRVADSTVNDLRNNTLPEHFSVKEARIQTRNKYTVPSLIVGFTAAGYWLWYTLQHSCIRGRGRATLVGGFPNFPLVTPG